MPTMKTPMKRVRMLAQLSSNISNNTVYSLLSVRVAAGINCLLPWLLTTYCADRL